MTDRTDRTNRLLLAACAVVALLGFWMVTP